MITVKARNVLRKFALLAAVVFVMVLKKKTLFLFYFAS